MARLPGEEAFGAPPSPAGGRGIASYRPTSGFEGAPAQELARSAAELETGAKIALLMKEQQDGLRAEEAFNSLRQKQVDLAYGKDGFANLKGANAVNQPVLKNYGAQFDTSAADLAAGLDNNYQKKLFQRRAQVAGLEFRQGIVHHIAKESDTYATNVFNGTLSTEINASTADPSTTGLSLTRIDAAINRHAERFGAPPEWVAAQKTEARSKLYTAQIQTQLSHDPLVASAYFEAHKNEIDATTRPVLERQIKAGVLPIEAKTVADTAMATMTEAARKSGVQAQLGDLLATGDQLADRSHPNDPVFRDLVQAQIKGYVNTQAAVRDGVSRQAYGTLLTSALGVQGGQKPFTLGQLLSTPKARQSWAIVEPTGQRGILALLEHNARDAQGIPMREDSTVVQDLLNRIYLPADDPSKIRNIGQLVPFFGKGLNRPAYDWLKSRMDELQTPEGQKLTDTRNSFFSGIKGQFDKSTLMNIDSKGGEDFYKFKQYATEREREYRNTPGKDPYQLYNPSSPEYLGKSIPAFQRTLEQQLSDMASSLRAPASTGTIGAPTATRPQQQAFVPGTAYTFTQGRFTYHGPENPTAADIANQSNWTKVHASGAVK